jgi:hypothetical protein
MGQQGQHGAVMQSDKNFQLYKITYTTLTQINQTQNIFSLPNLEKTLWRFFAVNKSVD